MRKIAFVTFGCRLNRAEALEKEAQARARGDQVTGVEEADVIVVRGCSVTAKAQRDCEREIRRLRERFPHAGIVVEGCLEEGTRDKGQGIRDEGRGGETWVVPTRTARGYLKVQDGCSGRCAFCIVPTFRGAPVSESFATVLDRARRFLEAGFRELVVTGCNLALYRDGGKGLADLLDALAGLEGPAAHRVRLGSLEPGIRPDEILDVFAARANVCRFIHLSLQSGSDSVLARMRRPYAAEAAARFCADARARLGARLALGADVIAGFPGETEAEFAATRAFVARAGFVNLHVFPYSERPGTAAAALPGAVPRAARRARAKELEAAGAAARAAFARSFVGREVEVCVERANAGWTDEYLRCEMTGDAPLPRRALATGRVRRVEGTTLFA